ncbi:MAG: hypothetical protein C0507_18060 [Cyanobacteria bacterium PR.3.49]|nr:hypothetical protein [Cyanobacteria bacterium PR.3.49]
MGIYCVRVEEIGSLSIELPDSFARGEVQMGGMGHNWRRVFQPRDKNDADDVSIVSFYRGSPAALEDAAVLRSLIKQPPAVIFAGTRSDCCSQPHVAELVRKLEPILGQCGNNQIANQETGVAGPRFFLEKLETISLDGRAVLSASGYFHDMELHPQAYFSGLFFDAQPESPHCCVEELVFEAQTRSLYDKYYPSFKQAVSTVRWTA